MRPQDNPPGPDAASTIDGEIEISCQAPWPIGLDGKLAFARDRIAAGDERFTITLAVLEDIKAGKLPESEYDHEVLWREARAEIQRREGGDA